MVEASENWQRGGGDLAPLDHEGHAAIWEFCEVENPSH